MPGAVIEVLVEVGQTVDKGQALLKLEAMKMEHTICSTAAGIVEAIYYAAGEQVEADKQLLKIIALTP
jgi:biotin carboxyl carrier protein